MSPRHRAKAKKGLQREGGEHALTSLFSVGVSFFFLFVLSLLTFLFSSLFLFCVCVWKGRNLRSSCFGYFVCCFKFSSFLVCLFLFFISRSAVKNIIAMCTLAILTFERHISSFFFCVCMCLRAYHTHTYTRTVSLFPSSCGRYLCTVLTLSYAAQAAFEKVRGCLREKRRERGTSAMLGGMLW
jgi:hypothetical protein